MKSKFRKNPVVGKIEGKMQIKDKRVIVTGAANDVGLTFSRELLRNGALVRYYLMIMRLYTCDINVSVH